MSERATATQIEAFLNEHPSWTLADGRLHREFKFVDFSRAFAFMTRVAMLAERENHHPEWCNRYNRVTIDLVTHEADGITERDFRLALAMEDLAA
jgi:4a-hydroxytetrahydrobiopterin dehydratase